MPLETFSQNNSEETPDASRGNVYRQVSGKLQKIKEKISRGARTVGVASALTLGALNSHAQSAEQGQNSRSETKTEAAAAIQGLSEDEVSLLFFYLDHASGAEDSADEGQKNLKNNLSAAMAKHPRVQAALQSLEHYFSQEAGDDFTNGDLFKNNLSTIEGTADKMKKPSDRFKLALQMVDQNKELINDTIPLGSESWQGSQLEKLRLATMSSLNDSIKDESNLIRTYDDKTAFEEYYKKKITDNTENYLKTLPAGNEKIKSVIEGMTEDEVSDLLLIIDHLPAEDAAYQKSTDQNIPIEEGEKNLERNLSDIQQKHPKIGHALGLLKDYLRFDGEEFRSSLAAIRQTPETLKKPSEVFRLAVDGVEKGHISFAHHWDDDALAQDKIDAAWNARPLKQYLELSLKKNIEELRSVEKNLNIDSVKSIIESSREQVVGYISSPEYLKKLIEAEGMTKEEAEAMQKKRVEAVRNVPYSISTDYMGSSETKKEAISYNAYDIAAYPKQNAPHEFTHTAMGLEDNITQKEREIYEAAAISPEEFLALKKNVLAQVNDMTESSPFNATPWNAYMSPAELAPRKFVLEMEMERVGIKKRFETMTHEHYLKVLELMKAGQLTHNVVQIILTTSEKGLLSIMNDLAYENTRAGEKGSVA